MRSIPMWIRFATVVASWVFVTSPFAQESEKPPIDWQPGPTVGKLGGFAQLDVPEGFLFTDKKGTQKLLELTHNLTSGDEVGSLVPAGDGPEDQWFVTFEFSEIGYVKDAEKEKIDAAKLLDTIRKGTEEANKVRKEKGWTQYHVLDWEKPPYYDPNTHNLTWAIRGRSENGSESINHSVRVLGRRGTMDVDLVLSPDQYASVVSKFDSLLISFKFDEGHRYADFIRGDKVATYGLAALIAGGAGAVAVKSGFWKVLVGLLLAAKKAVVLVVVAIFAFFKRILAMFRRPSELAPAGGTTGTGTMSSSSTSPAGSEPPPGSIG
jgi:uncharacterized membrane-anchored protein